MQTTKPYSSGTMVTYSVPGSIKISDQHQQEGTGMFTANEHDLLAAPYFRVIRTAHDYYEIQSRCTGHCWIIQKPYYTQRHPVRIYHKHGRKTPYYHRHGQANAIHSAIRQIKNHDAYVLQGGYRTLV